MLNSINIKKLFFTNFSTRQTILKNTFWLLAIEIFTKAVSFILAIWLARSYGPTIFGQWSFAISFVTFFIVIADFGFSTLSIREIARDKSKTTQYLNNITFIKILLGLLSLALISFISLFMEKGHGVTNLIFFLGLYTVINTFATFFQSIFRANEKMEYETITRFLQNICLLGLVAYNITQKNSIQNISYAYIESALLATFVSIIIIWKYISRISLKFDWLFCKKIIKSSWPFAISGMVAMLYFRADTVILSLLKTDQEVGWYNAAFNFVFALAFVPNLFMVAILPTLSRLFKEEPSRLKKVYLACFKTVAIMSLSIITATFLLSKNIIQILYGTAYLESILVLKILLIAVLASYFNHIFLYTLIAIDKQILYVKILFVILIINILLNIIIIPFYSYIGAGIIAAITELISFGVLLHYTTKNINQLS